MKDAIIKGLWEGFIGIMVAFALILMSIGMSELGKEHPNLVLAFYLSFIVTIPVTFNILSFRREEEMKKKEEKLSQVS